MTNVYTKTTQYKKKVARDILVSFMFILVLIQEAHTYSGNSLWSFITKHPRCAPRQLCEHTKVKVRSSGVLNPATKRYRKIQLKNIKNEIPEAIYPAPTTETHEFVYDSLNNNNISCSDAESSKHQKMRRPKYEFITASAATSIRIYHFTPKIVLLALCKTQLYTYRRWRHRCFIRVALLFFVGARFWIQQEGARKRTTNVSCLVWQKHVLLVEVLFCLVGSVQHREIFVICT